MEGVHRLGVRGDEGEVERAGRLPLDERQVLGIRRPQDHGGSHDSGGPGMSVTSAPNGSKAAR